MDWISMETILERPLYYMYFFKEKIFKKFKLSRGTFLKSMHFNLVVILICYFRIDNLKLKVYSSKEHDIFSSIFRTSLNLYPSLK